MIILNNISKKFDDKIINFQNKLKNYYNIYEKEMREFLFDFFEIKNLFNYDFALPKIPLKPTETNIQLNEMKKDSENLCVPIINIDSEGNNLICCYKTLDINLGKICPTFYEKPFIINIISFVNEDMTVKIKTYKENKIEVFDDKEKDNEENKNKDKNKEEEEKKDEKNFKESINIIKYEDEFINKLLNVKEDVKKGENICKNSRNI